MSPMSTRSASGCRSRGSPACKLECPRAAPVHRGRMGLRDGPTAELREGAHSSVCRAPCRSSGETCTDRSVVSSGLPNIGPMKKVKRTFGLGIRCRAEVNVKESDLSLDDRSSDSREDAQMPSPSSVAQEEETLTEGAERIPRTSTPDKTPELSQGFRAIPNPCTKAPKLCLRSVFVPLLGYLCELCNQKFSTGSELVKHKRIHESCDVGGKVPPERLEFPERVPEPPLPCNMCDRTFSTSQSLKRHKLLHVRDGRRCPKCGLIFCQLHGHVLFGFGRNRNSEADLEPPLPRPDPSDESSSDGSALESSGSFTDDPASTSPLEGPGCETCESSDDESDTAAATPLRKKMRNPLPPALHRKIPQKMPLPKLITVSNPQVFRSLRDDYPRDYVQPHLPQQPPLPPSLKVFSPQCLTSVLLEVRRNYEYIMSKPGNIKKPPEQNTAYDVEIVL